MAAAILSRQYLGLAFMRFVTAILAAAVLALPAQAFAGDIVGTVMDASGLPVEGLAVELGESGRNAVTDADGAYRITDVAAGEHSVAVSLADGSLQRVWVDVTKAGESRRNIFLVSAASIHRAQRSIAPADIPAESLSRTLELAERMIEDSEERGSAQWRWRDLDA